MVSRDRLPVAHVQCPAFSFCEIFIHTFTRLRDAFGVKLEAFPFDRDVLFAGELPHCEFKPPLCRCNKKGT